MSEKTSAFGYWLYEIKSREDGRILATGTSAECAEILGFAKDTFSHKIGPKIDKGIHPKFEGSRTWVPEKPPHRQHKKEPEPEVAVRQDGLSLCTDEYCGKCKFYAAGSRCCMYFDDMDMLRPCKAGPGCTVRKIGKRTVSANLGSLQRERDWDNWREWRKRK